MSDTTDAVTRELRAFGLAYPGAHSKSPWPGHDDLAVNDKTFAYLAADGEPFVLSCKLRYTSESALELPFAKPTGYGLGKSGWVTFTPGEAEMPTLQQMKDWIDESYRAQAPRKLVKALDESAEDGRG
jgi:predicted DNA-binding protein (MmcQ/YjbR family)